MAVHFQDLSWSFMVEHFQDFTYTLLDQAWETNSSVLHQICWVLNPKVNPRKNLWFKPEKITITFEFKNIHVTTQIPASGSLQPVVAFIGCKNKKA